MSLAHHQQALATALERLRDAPFNALLSLLVIGIALALPAAGWVALDNVRLAASGLTLEQTGPSAITNPEVFSALFPGTGGALYGRSSHGWMASFQRPGAQTKLPGLYIAGGSAHPGPGVPMAALSGRMAAARAILDLASTAPSRRTAMHGGMSTR